MLVSTLECYFKGRKELFKGLAIDSLETEWKVYPVIRFDFNGNNYTKVGELESTLKSFVDSLEEEYGKDSNAVTLGERFRAILKKTHEKTGLRVVVLIDEYDKPLLDVLDTGLKVTVDGEERLLEDWHRQVLKSFYGVFKGTDEDLRFVFLTGVTKFSQVSVFSDLNQLDDISMTISFEAICGITEEELYEKMGEPIKEMAKANMLSEEEMKHELKLQFDGYHFSPAMTDIYNPFSILNALKYQIIDNYWFRTGTPTYLVRLLAHTNEQMNELPGKYYPTQDFIDYKADVEAPLPMIYQSGYAREYESDLRRIHKIGCNFSSQTGTIDGWEVG